ncbi:MAG: ribosome small subunit-dependent GTPase A [Bacteroidia bacterium]|nr:ribosome small subunit-dependent GTPase A [Bacteroidia bacterium]
MTGVVVKSTGSWYIIRDDKGKRYECRMAGKIRLDNRKTTNPVAVGDIVHFDTEADGKGVIRKIDPRKNYIIRKSINLSKQGHILASNIDQAVLVVTLILPRTSTGFIDRFLVTAEAYQIPAVIVFNKKDMIDGELRIMQDDLMEMYTKIGYPCYEICAFDKLDVFKMKELFHNKTTLIAGHSGVGKSSLINALQPGLKLKVGELSDAHFKGKHTTTFAELFDLDFGGFIIDTPGIKELGVLEMTKEEVGQYFPEFRALMSACRFNNCTHTNEPGCAVLVALQKGLIDPGRYHNYMGILSGEEMDWKKWEN